MINQINLKHLRHCIDLISGDNVMSYYHSIRFYSNQTDFTSAE